jgi:hypothetical protein
MLSRFGFFIIATLAITHATVATAYQVKSTATSSYISVREVSANAFEVMFCKQGASQCIPLGNKKSYSMEELNSLKKSEYIKTGLTGAAAAAVVLTGAWMGAISGGILGLKYFAGMAAINSAVGAGAVGGAAITATGISLMDRVNPRTHYKTAKLVAKMNTTEVDYVSDVGRQANWIHASLCTLRD